MYEDPNGKDIDWVLNVHKISQIVILDLDNLPPYWKKLESYLVSFGNTYYLTKAEEIMYNKISANRIFAVEEIESKSELFLQPGGRHLMLFGLKKKLNDKESFILIIKCHFLIYRKCLCRARGVGVFGEFLGTWARQRHFSPKNFK